MELKDQVCTLEQAKRLEELGVKNKACFKHYGYVVESDMQYRVNYVPAFARLFHEHAAFTVAELGLMLPVFPDMNWETYYKRDNIVFCHAQLDDKPFGVYENEASARAEMLIHLLENNLITAEEVNQRLA